MTGIKNWEWFGTPGHFICADSCRFHLCTKVGDYLISTVGQYFPDAPVREIIANCRKVTLEGIGDNRRASYMEKIGFEEIGYGRLYETMVFKAGPRCDAPECSYGMPIISGSELDFAGYNDVKSANEGHLKLCLKYSRKRSRK